MKAVGNHGSCLIVAVVTNSPKSEPEEESGIFDQFGMDSSLVDRPHEAIPAIEFRDVHLGFDGHKALDGLSFKVMEGETNIILGSSGGGKSTVIKLVLGLLKPDTGRVLINGEDITEYS